VKISRFPGLGALLLLPLLIATWPVPGLAQDEDGSPGPDAKAEPESGEIPSDENPSQDFSNSPPPSSSAPSRPREDSAAAEGGPVEQMPVDGDGEAIPPEIQADVNADESGPLVDDSYNGLNNSGESLFSQIYVGPTVQVGFPNPLTYGLEALFARTVSLGFSGGHYTIDEIDKAELKIKGWDLHARWHPWMGSFFIGASYGRMELDGVYEDTYTARISGFERKVKARVNASIKTNYIAPRLGWFAVWDSGLCVGFDIGAQIPLGPDTKVVATAPGATPAEEAQIKATSDYKDLQDQADETVKVLGKRTLPIATLFRVGWLF
jgi:hypothetical protein